MLVLPQFFVEKSSQSHQVRYKPPKTKAQSQDRVQFCFYGGVLEFYDAVCSLLCKVAASRPNKMSYVISSLGEEFAFTQFKSNAGFVQ